MVQTVRYDDRDWVMVEVDGELVTVERDGWITDPPDIWSST